MSRSRQNFKPAPRIEPSISSLSATRVRLDEDGAWVEFDNGRIIRMPPAWFQPAGDDGAEPCENPLPSGSELHWEVVGDDISVVSLLAGLSALSAGKGNTDSAGVRIALRAK
jgi:Protein of unknown function (DUF2442)